VYKLNVDLQCYDEFTVKMETTEGFHTKTIRCQNSLKSPKVSETFVPRLSSMVSSVAVTSDYTLLANEIAEPIMQEYISDNSSSASHLKAFDLNQGVSTGLSQLSYDEEIIWQLKKMDVEQNRFNMIQMKFEYKKDRQIECNMFLYWVYSFLSYPYYMYFKMFGL
jgi:hypothetical protein